MEGDSKLMTLQVKIFHFNPLPPHGGRLRKLQNLPIGATFQSTPSAWRETSSLSDWELKAVISIHSLRMEGDISQRIVCVMVNDFNPLPPHGGRLFPPQHPSFHCPYFNPLPPHGGRPFSVFPFCHPLKFQSTPSAWRETLSNDLLGGYCGFQSTPSAWRETN